MIKKLCNINLHFLIIIQETRNDKGKTEYYDDQAIRGYKAYFYGFPFGYNNNMHDSIR